LGGFSPFLFSVSAKIHFRTRPIKINGLQENGLACHLAGEGDSGATDTDRYPPGVSAANTPATRSGLLSVHRYPPRKRSHWLLLVCLVTGLSGCAVITVADAAVSVAATAVKVTAKTVGAVADVAIPDGDDKE
jgi:hypothetical protein